MAEALAPAEYYIRDATRAGLTLPGYVSISANDIEGRKYADVSFQFAATMDVAEWADHFGVPARTEDNWYRCQLEGAKGLPGLSVEGYSGREALSVECYSGRGAMPADGGCAAHLVIGCDAGECQPPASAPATDLNVHQALGFCKCGAHHSMDEAIALNSD